MNILVDTDALVALAKTDDTNHQKAVKISKTLKEATLYISPFTIPEAVTVLSYRVSQKAACLFLEEVRKKTLNTIPLDKDLENLTDKIFLSQKAKGTSWPDCLNMAIYQKLKMFGIFSFDKVYEKNGLNTV